MENLNITVNETDFVRETGANVVMENLNIANNETSFCAARSVKSGYVLVKIMCEERMRANKIYLHTDNVVGREKMYRFSLCIFSQVMVER
ncbi:MAG: cyclic-phosphate processing receiver domain-containing protein [Tuberibacillus sp.]